MAKMTFVNRLDLASLPFLIIWALTSVDFALFWMAYRQSFMDMLWGRIYSLNFFIKEWKINAGM